MKKMMQVLLGCAVVSALGACGQKGPLYLPDKAGEVVTKPAQEATQTPVKKPAADNKDN